MPSSPSPSSDDALLARLNALKKSSVSFDTTHSASITPSAKAPAPTDDLAARFARLGSASPGASPKPSRATSSSDIRAPTVAPGAPSYLEGIAEGIGGGESVEFNEEDERTLGELLEDLGGRDKWDVSRHEEKDVGRLLKDVKRVLPEVRKAIADGRDQEDGNSAQIRRDRGKEVDEKLMDWENVEIDFDGDGSGVRVGRDVEHHEEGEEGGHEDNKKKTDEEEADDVIARIMAELAISKKYGNLEEPSLQQEDVDPGDHSISARECDDSSKPRDPSDLKEDSDLTLPSAPSSLPVTDDDDFAKTQALEDALTARLAALSHPSTSDSLGLPSAPSFSPTKKPPKVTSNITKFTDEEIDSWCIICYSDATLRCLGCDGDLYCQICWMEGHRGESAGYEEKTHKAVIFTRGKGERKKIAAG